MHGFISGLSILFHWSIFLFLCSTILYWWLNLCGIIWSQEGWFLWCLQDFVCVLWVSVSPHLWKFLNQISLTFKARFPSDSQALFWISRLESLVWGLEPSGIIVLQFVNHPPGSSMVWLIAMSSKTILTTLHGSQDCCCQCPCPRSGHCWPITLQETLKHSGRSGSVSCGDHHSFPWVLIYTSFRLCPPRVWSLRFAFKCNLNVFAPLFL